MADMGIGETIMAIAAATSAGAGIYAATKSTPKPPGMPQQDKSPTTDAFRRQNASTLSPGAAMAAGGTMLSSSSPNVGTSTLLGQ